MNKHNIKAINQNHILTMNFYDGDISKVHYLKRDNEVWIYDSQLVKELIGKKRYYRYAIDMETESLVITNTLNDVLGIINRYRNEEMEETLKYN